jgi:hypothetical protein
MKVVEHVSEFLPTTLNEMDGVKLLSRSDTKFAFSVSILKDLMYRLTPFYNVLEIEHNTVSFIIKVSVISLLHIMTACKFCL